MRRFALFFALSVLVASAQKPAEVFPTSAGELKITPVMHASLYMEAGGQVVYVDPAQGSYEGLPKADIVLITDIHGDHMNPEDLAMVRQPSTVVIGPAAVAAEIEGTQTMNNGDTKTVGDWTFEAIPMYNLPAEGKQIYHPRGRGNGYVVTYGGVRIYLSGDTEGIPEMRALNNIDVAFVCMNLPFTMTPEAAADAVRAFHPRIVYPYHYRGQDTTVFRDALADTDIDVRLRDWY